MKKVKKAVIPAAGLGTRFLPATKTIPKEMLPIVDKPTILHVVEEAVQAGIEDVVLIAGRGKHSIEDFFDISYELESKLVKDGKESILKSLHELRSKVNIISIRQKNALGLGHAVQCARPIVGDEPFAVLLGDELTISEDRSQNVTYFLTQKFAETQTSSVWVLPVDPKDTSKYGIVDLGSQKFSELSAGQKVKAVVEKPATADAPSLWALPGRYVFNSDIFEYLQKIKTGAGGEFQLSDAMNMLAAEKNLRAYSFEATRFDAGDKLGFLIANLEMAFKRPGLGDDLKKYLKKRLSEI